MVFGIVVMALFTLFGGLALCIGGFFIYYALRK